MDMYSNNLICDILIYINNNILDKITIESLEKRFFYNRYYIMKLFKQEIGLTLIEYINSIRIYNSIMQLKNNNYSLTNIAFRNGFYSLEYFSETFKHITDVNPRLFKYYFHNQSKLSIKQIDKINATIIKLYEIVNIKDKYLSNKKINNYPVKKLSIFK